MNKLLLSLICFCLVLAACSQKSKDPFRDEIEAFKKADRSNFPPKHAILFCGSSSFRFWDGIATYFPRHKIINRGFGGSTIPDVIFYANDILFPYQPGQVVIYCGENDVATDTVSAGEVFNRFKQLFQLIRQKLPSAKITYVSMKPSPSRRKYFPIITEGNTLIEQFLQQQPNASFIDVYHPMLDRNGQPLGELFRDDSLHMNGKGYRIWQQAIEPHLIAQ